MYRFVTKPAFLFIFLSSLCFLCNCQYEYVEIDLPNETVQVSFSDEILPIFDNNSCTACHSNGSLIDLRPDNAYSSIVPDLINEENPSLSLIYQYPNPTYTGHQYKKYTPYQAALVFNWIKQGAMNN
nr:hypothetical protein [uncultured Carboxylicivirga sp.]